MPRTWLANYVKKMKIWEGDNIEASVYGAWDMRCGSGGE